MAYLPNDHHPVVDPLVGPDEFREDETTMRALPPDIADIDNMDDFHRKYRSLYATIELRYDVERQEGRSISADEMVSKFRDYILHDLEHDWMLGLENDLEASLVFWFLQHNKYICQRVEQMDKDFDQGTLSTLRQEWREMLHTYMNVLNEIKHKLISSIRKGEL